MKKYTSSILLVFLAFAFTYCSVEKDASPVPTEMDSSTLVDKDTMTPEFTLLAENHVPNSDAYFEGGILQNQNANSKFNIEKRSWQGMPSVGKDLFGNLYVVWITGGSGEGPDNYLTVSMSSDQGKNWSHDKLILYANVDSGNRVRDPSLFNDKYGNLYLSWAKNFPGNKAIVKPWSEVWYSKLDWSATTETISYSAPRKIAEGIMINKPFNSTLKDEMVFPIAVWYVGDHALQQPFMYKGTYSSTNLVGFAKVGGITMDPSVPNQWIYEHMFVELKDGTYLGMTRDDTGLFYSYSKDGKIWDTAKKFTKAGVLSASTRFHLARLNSGRLILIFNNDYVRTNLTVCLSDDDGLTWPYRRIIDKSDDVVFGASYPDMIETDPGILNIVYDYLRQPIGTIKFLRIDEEDIVKNNQVEILRTKISTVK